MSLPDITLRNVAVQQHASALICANAFILLQRDSGILNREEYVREGEVYRCYGTRRGVLIECMGTPAPAPLVPVNLDERGSD